MNVTFGVGEQPVTPPATAPAAPATPTTPSATTAPTAPAVPAPQAVATRPTNTAVAAPQSANLLGDFIPGFDDIILPRLNIVQNIGKLSEHFEKGALVFNQQEILFLPPKINEQTGTIERQATPPVILTVLGWAPIRYVEKVPGGGKGLMVSSEDAVRAAGGTLDYKEWELKQQAGMKRFERLADAVVAIERPDRFPDDESIFNYEVDGKKYAIAKWAMRGTSYTEAAKRVFFTSRRTGCLMKGGYPSWSFAVSTRQNSYSTGNKAWVPVCIANKKSTPAFLDFSLAVRNAPPEASTPVAPDDAE